MRRLDSKVAFLTGGGGVLGRATLAALHERTYSSSLNAVLF